MTTDRFFAEPVPQDLIAWSWHVIDRQIGQSSMRKAWARSVTGRRPVADSSARQKGNKHDFDDEDGQVEPDNPSDDGDQP
jgi:hypothetical protein